LKGRRDFNSERIFLMDEILKGNRRKEGIEFSIIKINVSNYIFTYFLLSSWMIGNMVFKFAVQDLWWLSKSISFYAS
jgi:hypothetical protein